MKRCPRCNSKVKDSDTFCIHCGYHFPKQHQKHTGLIISIILAIIVICGITMVASVTHHSPSPDKQNAQQTSQITNQSNGNYQPAKINAILKRTQKQDHKYIKKLVFDKNYEKNGRKENMVLVYLTPYAIHKFKTPNKQDKNDEPASHTGSVEDTSITNKINSQLSELNQYLPDNKGTLQTKFANYNMKNDSQKGLGPVNNKNGNGKPEY